MLKARLKRMPNKFSPNKSWAKIQNKLKASSKGIVLQSEKCFFMEGDARVVLANIPDNSINCIITSPPYGGMKDYGSKKQIGFQQDPSTEFFPDIERILKELLRVAANGSALWMVLGTWKLSGSMVPLPWEIINRAVRVGWTCHDVVIWDKGKSLPWSHPGKFRGVCEYVVLLGKGKLSNFDLGAVRDTDQLSPYWVRYPERFHPDGKAPSDLWHFPIPTQGSWSNGQERHFCPFPLGLIARMISISTEPGHVVLDPFSGTGSVLAVANHLNRYGFGIEVNPSFVRDFEKKGIKALKVRAHKELPKKNKISAPLRETIIQLRMMKCSKTLFSELSRQDRLNSNARDFITAFIIKSHKRSPVKNDAIDTSKLGKIELCMLASENADLFSLKKEARKCLKVPPLSKFGLLINVQVIPFKKWRSKGFSDDIPGKRWCLYEKGKFFKFSQLIKQGELIDFLMNDERANLKNKFPVIFSKIKLSVSDQMGQ